MGFRAGVGYPASREKLMNGNETTGEAGKGPQEDGAPSEPFRLPEGFADDATAEIVRRAKDGDAEALNLTLRALQRDDGRGRAPSAGAQPALKEDPDDLAQTTFREAQRDFKKYEYRGEQALVRWLVQILQNKIRDRAEYWGASKRNPGRLVSLDANSGDDDRPRLDPSSHDLSVTTQVQRKESFSYLRKGLEQLNPEYRQAITLVFFEGKTLREAGEIMGGRTEDALRMMLRRAEAKLREILRTSVGRDYTGEGPGS
jgi:RNA polymerase sigma factor (sigma-70 family)